MLGAAGVQEDAAVSVMAERDREMLDVADRIRPDVAKVLRLAAERNYAGGWLDRNQIRAWLGNEFGIDPAKVHGVHVDLALRDLPVAVRQLGSRRVYRWGGER